MIARVFGSAALGWALLTVAALINRNWVMAVGGAAGATACVIYWTDNRQPKDRDEKPN